MTDPEGRERILTAAAGLFYPRGVRAIGMAEVIQAAGCGKNMLYRHFPSKGALAAAYLRKARESRDARTDRDLTAAGDNPAERLVALIASVADQVRASDYRGCAFRNYLTEFPRDTDEPAGVARAYLTDSRHQVDALVAALPSPPPALADRLWLLIDGLYGATEVDPAVAVTWARELLSATPG